MRVQLSYESVPESRCKKSAPGVEKEVKQGFKKPVDRCQGDAGQGPWILRGFFRFGSLSAIQPPIPQDDNSLYRKKAGVSQSLATDSPICRPDF